MTPVDFGNMQAPVMPMITPPAGGRGGKLFAQSLSEAGGPGDDSTARTAARQLVASSFVQPVLQSMRKNTFATGPFAPGLAEQRFGHMLDQVQADRIVSAANFHLVDAVVAHMDKAMQGAQTIDTGDTGRGGHSDAAEFVA